MALVKADETGKMTSFEEPASYLLPSNPVAKKRLDSPVKRAHGNISSVSTKKSDGSSGVEFRYYKKSEYDTLSDAQTDELRQWCSETKGKGDSRKDNSQGRSYSGSHFKKEVIGMISAAFASELKKQKDKNVDASEAKECRQYLVSMLVDSAVGATNAKPTAKKEPQSLQTILKCSKRPCQE